MVRSWPPLVAAYMYSNKRKREEDRHHLRPNPQAQLTSKLRRGVAELGEPSHTQTDLVLRELAENLSTSRDDVFEPVFRMIRAVTYEQPHKIPLLAALIELVYAKRPEFGQMAVDMIHEETSRALKLGEYSRVKLFVRLAADLSIVDPHSVDSFLVALLELGSSLDLVLATLFFSTALFAAVYLVHGGHTLSMDLQQKLQSFHIEVGDTQDIQPFYGDGAPYTAVPIPTLLTDAAKAWIENGLDTSFLLDTTTLIGERPQAGLRFAAIDLPSSADLVPVSHKEFDIFKLTRIKSTPQLYTQLYLPLNGCETVPSSRSLFALFMHDVALDNIAHMDFNKKEVTRQLITLDLFFNTKLFAPPGALLDEILSYPSGEATWKVEDIALEAVLGELLRLPAPIYPTVYYDSIMIEACIMAPQAIAPVLGRALRFLFINCAALDTELFFRVTDWFAHHVSNFGFTWKWKEWLESLDLPEMHPKQVFMRELVIKQVRLSYPQRVRDVLPPEFQHLVPDIPEIPEFKYENNSQAQQLLDGLYGNPESGRQALEALREHVTQDNIGKEVEEIDQLVADIFVTTICHLGSRSLSHADTWIERTKDLLLEVSRKQWVCESVLEFWKASPWIGLIVLESFVRHGVLTGVALVRFVFSRPKLLFSSAGWELLSRHTDGLDEELKKLPEDDEWRKWWKERFAKAALRQRSVLPDVAAASKAADAAILAEAQKLAADKAAAKAEVAVERATEQAKAAQLAAKAAREAAININREAELIISKDYKGSEIVDDSKVGTEEHTLEEECQTEEEVIKITKELKEVTKPAENVAEMQEAD